MARISKVASDAIIKYFVLPLMQWAAEINGAFFFLVIGDKNVVDVAWSNSYDLSCDGAFAIVQSPEAAGAFTNLNITVEQLLEDKVKDKDFDKIFQHTTPKKEDSGWESLSLR